MAEGLEQFLTENREEIIARTRAKVMNRPAPRATDSELENGIPLFLTQLVAMLGTPAPRFGQTEIGKSATQHGEDMRRTGFTVGQVVQDYGGLCQAITELAVERGASISSGDFKILNGCLDGAVASAVTEFARHREESISNEGVEQLGMLAHELRNALHVAMLAFGAVRAGAVGANGSTSAVVERSLIRMRDLLDRSLAEVRLKAGLHRQTRMPLGALVEEVSIAAAVEAAHRGLELTIGAVPDEVMIKADAQILTSALSNLLQNAFKFTPAPGRVWLRVDVFADRVRIEVEDECGGLPPGKANDLFRMFEQRGDDRSGLGLGLAIARQGVEESRGTIAVRDVPGKGCVFTINLPREA